MGTMRLVLVIAFQLLCVHMLVNNIYYSNSVGSSRYRSYCVGALDTTADVLDAYDVHLRSADLSGRRRGLGVDAGRSSSSSSSPPPSPSSFREKVQHTSLQYAQQADYSNSALNLTYETVNYANLSIRINRAIEDGPGLNLFTDPLNISHSLYVGNTINRKTFETQIIMDLAQSLSIQRERILVADITKGSNHFSWEASCVIVQLIFLERNNSMEPTLLETVTSLTQMVQDNTTILFHGTNVTKDVDSGYGVDVKLWDVSLRLSYAIDVIGGDSVVDGYALNQGGLGLCDGPDFYMAPTYCQFEGYFEHDVSRALGISVQRVQVLFIKSAALDAVLVFFRLFPPPRGDTMEENLVQLITKLSYQARDMNSELYRGNVTIRVDPLWGVSNTNIALRRETPLYTYKYFELDDSFRNSTQAKSMYTSYDRCKANGRCNWGVTELNQTSNTVQYYQQLFSNGQLFPVDIFLDFEDWRLGTRGLRWDRNDPGTYETADLPIRGSHFSPYDQTPLGPTIPAYLLETNQGLVLDRQSLVDQVATQEALVSTLQAELLFMGRNIETMRMDATRRARIDVRQFVSEEMMVTRQWYDNEMNELIQLNSSQCVATACTLTFDTSSMQLTGTINGTGELRRTTSGTEIAVFTFASILLGPEVQIRVVGQRALGLASRTSIILNSSIVVNPGTLGGMPGGGSVGRAYPDDSLSDTPVAVPICYLGEYCSEVINVNRSRLVSNNVNGPGSGSVLSTAFVVRTTASHIPEIQEIRTNADSGQTLSGGFIVQFKQFTSSIIPFDASAGLLKRILEDDLNLLSPADEKTISGGPTIDRSACAAAGVGILNVSRMAWGDAQGYRWLITFTTAVGDIQQLKVTSLLQSRNATVNIGTIRDGNDIGGSFSLSVNNQSTPIISHAASASDVRQALLTIPFITAATVTRNDPSGNCDDGLCANGPYAAHGYQWTCLVSTNSTLLNVTPLSPTSTLSAVASGFLDAAVDNASLSGVGATVEVYQTSTSSTNAVAAQLVINQSFSLAFGGAGASYGGVGGTGYGGLPTGSTYNDDQLSDLLGGSGGCMRSGDAFEINWLRRVPHGRGGDGGGAIELVAANDIRIGSFGELSVRGGHGQQASEGGGGGGSGGSILLAAGGVVVIEGRLDASGGDGGFGGYRNSQRLAGGGGSGGRIALFGQSIVSTFTTASSSVNNSSTTNSTSSSSYSNSSSSSTSGVHSGLLVSGGACGRLAKNTRRVEFQFEAVLELLSSFPLLENQWLDATQLVMLESVSLLNSTAMNYSLLSVDMITGEAGAGTAAIAAVHVSASTISRYVNVSTALNVTNSQADLDLVYESLAQQVGVYIAGLRLLSVRMIDSSLVIRDLPTASYPSKCTNTGFAGTVYSQADMSIEMSVQETVGGENTSHALFLSNDEVDYTASGSLREVSFSWDGPTVAFASSRPERVTFYMRVGSDGTESKKNNFGALFSLVSHDQSGLNVSNVVGIFLGFRTMHGANFGSAVDEKVYAKQLITIDEYPALNRWYKFDLKLTWAAASGGTYNVSIDDTLVVSGQSFEATNIDGIRLSVTRAIHVWFDEIYVGFDSAMAFVCPTVNRYGTQTMQPTQRSWSFDEVHGGNSNGYTEYYQMQRHYNDLASTGTLPLDGQGLVKDNQDIKLQYANGDYLPTQGRLPAGSLLYVTNSLRSGKTAYDGRSSILVSPPGLWYRPADGVIDGRSFWYTEYTFTSNLTSALNGGVVACSSQDLQTWRFEGIVFYYVNLTDTVSTAVGPFALERPMVLWNANTSLYVMWAAMDNANRSLALNAVFASPFVDGPFYFLRSFYPDGNQTRDQVIYNSGNSSSNDGGAASAVVGRTYYLTVDYVLPAAMMQPVWESVKSHATGTIDYRANYHRAWYDIGYDNYNDIYLQRWRSESQTWNVTCVNKITGARRQVPYGTYSSQGSICLEPDEYKEVYGQGNPEVTSRFVSPVDFNYSWWRPTSVPGVQAQPWASNYQDGYCGIRKLNDDYDELDPDLASFEPTDRSTCSNIADNPIFTTLQDKLIGVLLVVTTRRAKYLAVSELTSDFLDTTGRLNTFEGELRSGQLISMIPSMAQFGLEAGDSVESTFVAPQQSSEFDTALNYKTRFRQYIYNYNDRALYSLACVLDGVCPVNFRDEITTGNT